MMKIYDGTGLILGRLATRVAKDLLLGDEVTIVNCEKIIISGRKTNTLALEKQRRDRKGYPTKSAKHTRMADRFVRRTVRGMLPWKQSRGREAFKRVMCHNGIPAEFAGKEMITVEQAAVKKLPTLRYITVGDLMNNLGGKA